MSTPTDEEIREALVGIISDGFNRSLGALANAGAVDRRKMLRRYRGVGDLYYDLVTEQIVYTAKYGAAAIRKLFSEDTEIRKIDGD